MLRLAQHKQELDLQLLKQEEKQMKEEQALILAELEEDNRRRLAEATLAELKLTEDVSETSPSLRDALSELSTHNQRAKSVRLNKLVTNTSTDVENQFTQVQDSKIEKETHPGSLTGVHADVATEFGRPNTTPPSVSVPNLTNSNQPPKNHFQYFVKPNATNCRYNQQILRH